MRNKQMIWLFAALAGVLVLLALFPVFTGVVRYEHQEKPMTLQEVTSQVPVLLLTDEEIALADSILAIPEICDALERELEGELQWEFVANVMASIRPDWAEHASVSILGQGVIVDFLGGTRRLILEYYDRDGGSADLIRKTWSEESGTVAPTIYTAEYIPILEETRYQVSVSRRHFAFF